MKNKIKNSVFIYLLLFLMFSFKLFAQSIDTLHVILDMRTPISQGWLNPANEKVGLRGDAIPLSWGTTYLANDKDGDGIYFINIPFKQILDSLNLNYKIKVDGVNNPNDGWQLGRNHKFTIYHGRKNLLSLKWEDQAKVPASTITGTLKIIKNFDCTPLLPRNIFIYLPPGYNKTNRRYNVLYMQDGQNIFDASITGEEWKMDETAQLLIKQKQIEPLIIVGIGNTKNRIDEYTPTRQVWKHTLYRISPSDEKENIKKYIGTFVSNGGDTVNFNVINNSLVVQIPGSSFWQALIEKSENSYYQPRAGITFQFKVESDGSVKQIIADKPSRGGEGNIYADLIINKIKPYIDKNFRTKKGPQYTGLGGSSLGGLISLYIGLDHPDIFGSLLIVSPSIWWDKKWIIKRTQKLSKPTGQRIWLDIGTGEGKQAVINARALKTIFIKKHWLNSNFEYREIKGARHNERAWAKRVPDMLRFVFNRH